MRVVIIRGAELVKFFFFFFFLDWIKYISRIVKWQCCPVQMRSSLSGLLLRASEAGNL